MPAKDAIRYGVGALLYTPATNRTVAKNIINNKIPKPFSMALCLEDTISESAVTEAETQAVNTLTQIRENHEANPDSFLPKIFIRVREPAQIIRLWYALGDNRNILTGFIFPKYSVNNAGAYNDMLLSVNRASPKTIYGMPILETPDLAAPDTRAKTLREIRNHIDSIQDLILNVRTGGNDFCNLFSVRRHIDETIYEILPVAHILADIIATFQDQYIISGPVWEFYADRNDAWKQGLEKELKLDRLSGFIGKTAIHPNQIPIINQALKVSTRDYTDADRILNWSDKNLLVAAGSEHGRMNEVRTHENWARKIMTLANIYGVQ